MQKSQESKKRIDGMDAMKAMGILMVLSLHVSLWSTDFIREPSGIKVLEYALRLISEGVPIFVMANGFFILNRRSLDLRAHCKKMLKMFILFWVWGLILVIAGHGIKDLSIGYIVKCILGTISGSEYTGVLWFIENLLALYFIYPLLWEIFQKRFDLFRYLFVLIMIFVAGTDTVELLRDALSGGHLENLLNDLLFFINRFNFAGNGWFLLYFMLGGMIRKYSDYIQNKRAIFTAFGFGSWLLSVWFGYYMSIKRGYIYDEWFNYGSIFMIIILVGLYAMLSGYRNNGGLGGRFIASVGQNTFGIYLSHFMFIYFLNALTGAYVIKRSICFIIIFTVSYAFAVTVKKLPFICRMVEL